MKKIFLLLIICCLFSTTTIVLAQGTQGTEYNLLTPLPNVETTPGSGKATASSYIKGIFQLIIAVAGLLAVIMIIFGGIKYMSTDAFSGKSEARATIEHAIWGLLLAMSAWLILNTINPNLVNFNLNVPTQQISTIPTPGTSGATLPWYPLSPADLTQDQTMRTSLSQNVPPVTVNNSPCTTPGVTSGCTNIVGLPLNAIAGVSNLATSCNCTVQISGGTEGGHVTHGPNIPVMDLSNNSAALNSYITTNGQPTNTASCSQLGPQYSLSGAIYVNEGSHWHVCY